MSQGKPIANGGSLCPLFRKDTSKVCHRCAWYVRLLGISPNTGHPIDEWACAIAWGPILQIEQSNKLNGVGAATESLRNLVSEGQKNMLMVTPKGG